MKSMKTTILLLTVKLLILCCLPGYSQHQKFRFSHLTTDHGLSQSNITSILQDDKGFLWFGTFNGLNKYNGYEFEIFNYQFKDTTSISHNYISSLFQDKNGYLWVGTSDGLNQYDYETNRYKSYKNEANDPGSIADNQIETILEDSRGRLWIGTRNGGLDLFDPENESFIHHFYDKNNPGSISSDRIEELFEDSDGNLWIAHMDGSIDILSAAGNGSDAFSVIREKITDVHITAIVESADKNIWIGTQGDGVYRVTFENGQLRQLAHYTTDAPGGNSISSNIVLCLMIEDDSKLWIGTEDDGINILNTATNQFDYIRHDPLDQSSLNHNSIWQIYKDRAGNIWIGTYAYGINLLSGNKSFIHHYSYQAGNPNSLSHNMVNAFFEDENEQLWIATDGGGLNLFDRKNDTFSHYTTGNTNIDTDVIVSLLADRRGRLWVGSWTNGLYQFNPATQRFIRYTMKNHGLGSNRVLDIFEDNNSGLWLATFYGGLTYFNTENQTAVVYNSKNSGLSDDYTRVVYQDPDKNIWIGTDSGLDFFDTQTNQFHHFKHDIGDTNSLSKGFVHSIIQTGDSEIWIGTTGGLNKLDRKTNRFIHYTIDNGLPDNEIKCIVEDNDGSLWLSTNKGISQFNRKTETFKNYDVSDGLQGNEFNARSGWKTRAGNILFGGNNGFNIFQPGQLKKNATIPPVFLTDFKIFNTSVAIGESDNLLPKHISEIDEITLAHWQSVFSINYVTLNYVSPEKNRYAYMMEGFETDWNYVGPERTATYTNLDPGSYTFRVKASNNDGLWNTDGTAINITINPPFWKTWWAFLIQFIVAVTAIAFVINYFVSRQRLRNALKIEHLELEKMYELDRLKTQFFSNISHEFHSPLTLILTPLEKLISTIDKNEPAQESLKLIHRNAQRLQRMINQLKNFQKIQHNDMQLQLSRGDIVLFIREIARSFQEYAVDHRIQYQFNAAPERFTAWFDADKLDKIIYNVLSNAFKFTPAGGEVGVRVSIIHPDAQQNTQTEDDLPSQYVEIVVTDNGIGIPADKIEDIFKRYYQIERENGQYYPGSGIGLAFANELVNLYQGKIFVKSSEGNGSTFSVQIPVDEHFLEAKQLVGEFSADSGKQLVNWDFAETDNAADDVAANAPESLSEKSMPIILVVEDDDEIRNFIKKAFQSKYRIVCAANGNQGITEATTLIPDLVISDIKMPETSGIELCNRLKEDEKTSHIPIILLTAYKSREYKIEGLQKGADAYLSKPFNIDELDIQITNLLQIRKKLKEKYCRQIMLEPANVEIEDIDEKFIQRVLKIVEQHMADSQFNAEVLSKEIGMSRMQLYRKIRGLTNLTVHEFIRTIRLKRATELLKEKRMTITEVAYEVGFNDLTYFARCFRKQYQKSPSEFVSGKE